ncbi:NUDIX domain-containing protein [Streptomyces sp. NPDC059371]|uniref:NUDIX domain-containing protein n=1 Tax=Streptomyces sp. NPDC059371 TaxID=3346812 RepID=UPI0036C367AF
MSSESAQPVIDTHVIVRDGDKILFSQRGGPYGHGRWHMPSGKVDQGEELSYGAAWELSEETGLEVDPAQLRLVLALEWFTVHDLPEDLIEYPEAGLRGYLDDAGTLVEHNWA